LTYQDSTAQDSTIIIISSRSFEILAANASATRHPRKQKGHPATMGGLFFKGE